MALSLPVQPLYPQDRVRPPKEPNPSALCQRPPEFGFDPRFLLDRRYDPMPAVMMRTSGQCSQERPSCFA
jgi:hypothetical protein